MLPHTKRNAALDCHDVTGFTAHNALRVHRECVLSSVTNKPPCCLLLLPCEAQCTAGAHIGCQPHRHAFVVEETDMLCTCVTTHNCCATVAPKMTPPLSLHSRRGSLQRSKPVRTYVYNKNPLYVPQLPLAAALYSSTRGRSPHQQPTPQAMPLWSRRQT
jgi:hypothetical protein